jgi:two-component system phosphate regulon sensor histidine kinase PhoR
MLLLIGLQFLWFYNTYQLELSEIKDFINRSFIASVENELSDRFIEAGNQDLSEDMMVAQFDVDDNDIEVIGINSFLFNSAQLCSYQMGILFNINKLDSIYTSSVKTRKFSSDHQLIYLDSLDQIVETCGEPVSKGFETTTIPIINGNKVKAIVKITPPVVFQNMLKILIVSALLLCFILICFVYGIRAFLTQHYLNELREDFTNTLIHELKTPLGTIHAVLEQFNKGALDGYPEKRNKFYAIASGQIFNLQSLVNEILTVAYIEEKQLSLNKQTIDLPQMIQSLMDKFAIKGGKPVRFVENYDIPDVSVYVDPLYLNNAISNLIDNAIKYSGDSVLIEINCFVKENQVHICLKDNGLGISRKDQQNVFKKFERGAEIKMKKVTGFGLGLNYVQKVVEAHGGTVTLLSQLGVGSEFVISIPLFSPGETQIME